MARRRVAVLIALAAVTASALASRRWPLPGVLAEHTGDALYATAAFLVLAIAVPAAGTSLLATAAWAFAALVELSQLLTWPWLGQIRATRLGALLLGQGFQVADLVAYAIGVGLAAVVDATFLRGSTRWPADLDRLPHQSRPPR